MTRFFRVKDKYIAQNNGSFHQYRSQDPVMNSVLSDSGEALTMHVFCYADRIYNICSGVGTLKLLLNRTFRVIQAQS